MTVSVSGELGLGELTLPEKEFVTSWQSPPPSVRLSLWQQATLVQTYNLGWVGCLSSREQGGDRGA